MKIGWDINKAESNVRKHGISFDEAQTVFDDDYTVTLNDDLHSFDERRYITIGQSFTGRLLFVCHTFEENEIRIISARKLTKSEREKYENG